MRIFADMKRIGTSWLIHGFALLHMGVTLACTLAGIPDSLLLTALTMALAVLICMRENLTVEITVASLLLVNILGFLLGNFGAGSLAGSIPPMWQHALTTLVVTELLGWGLYLFAHRFFRVGPARYEHRQSWKKNRPWLALAVAAIFGFRVYTEFTYKGNLLQESGVVASLVILSVAALSFMVYHAMRMQNEVSSQRTRRHQAEFRYMTLKHQVNPHFLFNSLNVLDSIVQDGSREEASAYVHKLANVYRYLMQQEGKPLVPLKDEVAFARTYRELIQIRFPEGLVMDDRMGDPVPEGYIIPCALQLLLENATKHNAINPDNPLVVRASINGRFLTVSNNLIPKLSTRPSTGIGLQYIRNQYRDLAGEEIEVVKTADSFSVTLPILEKPE